MKFILIPAVLCLTACASMPDAPTAEKTKYRASRLNAQYEPRPEKIEPYQAEFYFSPKTEFFSTMTLKGSEAAKQCQAYASLQIANDKWLASCKAALGETDLTSFNRVATLYNQGLIQMKLGYSDAAQESFEAANQQDPNFAAGYFGRAMIASNQFDYKAAIALAEKSIELDLEPTHEAYNLIGYARERQFDFDKARTAYRQALKIRPGASDARLNLERLNRLWPEKPVRNFVTEI